jgi:hypothetical protein
MTNEAQPTRIVAMEMLERHLNDLFAAIVYCYENELLMPCLVLLYSGIDVAASLEPSAGKGVGERFEKWVERYMLKGRSLPCTARELYAARCAVVHTFTPNSNLSKTGKARVIGYAFGNELSNVNVEFVSAREAIDTSGPMGRMFLTMVGSIAELERSLIVERIKAGMRRAKMEGRTLGRAPLSVDRNALVRDRLSGMSLTDVAKKYRISRASVVRVVRDAKQRQLVAA